MGSFGAFLFLLIGLLLCDSAQSGGSKKRDNNGDRQESPRPSPVVEEISVLDSKKGNAENPSSNNENKTPLASDNKKEVSSLTGNSETLSKNIPETQHGAQVKAAEVNQIASTVIASVSVATCAEGANTIHEDEVGAGILIDSCLEGFESANEAKEMEAKADQNSGRNATSMELEAHDAALNSETANTIFEDFENKYGVTKEAFAKKLLEAKGDPNSLGTEEALQELFNGKLSRDEIESALKAAQAASGKEKDEALEKSRVAGLADQFLYDIKNGRGKIATTADKLRDALKKKLENGSGTPTRSSQDMQRQLSSISPTHSAPLESESLTPSDHPFFFSREKEDAHQDPTLFEAVHKKYLEKSVFFQPRAPFMKLPPIGNTFSSCPA